MQTKQIDADFSVSEQIKTSDLSEAAKAGFKSVICNRPDGEGPDQSTFAAIEKAAKKEGLEARYIPVVSGKLLDFDADAFGEALNAMPKPILAYCRTGTRSATLWALDQGRKNAPLSKILAATKAAGYDMSTVARRIAGLGKVNHEIHDASADVVIVGGGAAGIAVASSLLARKSDLDIVMIEPIDVHYYQPGWTMVGAGVFEAPYTAKNMASLIPGGVRWIKASVAAFEPQSNAVILEGKGTMTYKRLIVAPGLKLNWAGIEGLSETLGRNGVTSNYRYDLAPYTWKLVQGLKAGGAIFTQPPMPIKCAGAPQKALYLSADYWHRMGHLNNIKIDFFNAGAVLFGVKEYVPPLMKYIEKYNAQLNFGHTLTKIDGDAKTAWFTKAKADGTKETVEKTFDMIHVVPPQQAPDFIRVSPLADAAGWVDVDQKTLRHKGFDNIWSLGDVMNAPNAKTAAAARKQAPIVANNLLKDMGLAAGVAHYDGYGSCPLTVERGKIVFAEFGYGGKLLPTFPKWLIDGQQPSSLAWLLKERVLPPLYWKAMLKGREWLAKPDLIKSELVG